ncbi:hypothetical protein A3J90_05660 [candidate division WOR-1 bacterium RIFOXYC2_FULL_37_10]|uniref:Methyltransferase domain-containing protein n=1 Tax=candidate division WOR-1 bacterium RIFOXYB2_FULL_37_13 TaxID=1802579 RepID=A0A1F4SDV5_UNCSA|nr:MAG: hypothetical protein A2310_02150 [candidate division WOR-1 bacterium RIFOXYB2_FULL_37_13]OGC37122.1 MAG: hypothetical protein A3J90_05660 [candidate division WOR-1 bacterium RIFOXYC2_FULL_37_10]
MDTKTKDHYENHLAEYYSWIYGGADQKIEENNSFFEKHSIKPFSSKVAIDLGCGSGFQSISLAKAGFNVMAVDFSKKLIDELKNGSLGLNVEPIESDILDFNIYKDKNPELIVCMGDTLTHMPDLDSASNLIFNSYKELEKNGKLILSFRDLTFELQGKDRFIPVRSDENTIFTCFLEYQSESVNVYDLVHARRQGKWEQKISSYKKIKISQDKTKQIILDAGFTLDFFEVNRGLVILIAKK